MPEEELQRHFESSLQTHLVMGRGRQAIGDTIRDTIADVLRVNVHVEATTNAFAVALQATPEVAHVVDAALRSVLQEFVPAGFTVRVVGLRSDHEVIDAARRGLLNGSASAQPPLPEEALRQAFRARLGSLLGRNSQEMVEAIRAAITDILRIGAEVVSPQDRTFVIGIQATHEVARLIEAALQPMPDGFVVLGISLRVVGLISDQEVQDAGGRIPVLTLPDLQARFQTPPTVRLSPEEEELRRRFQERLGNLSFRASAEVASEIVNAIAAILQVGASITTQARSLTRARFSVTLEASHGVASIVQSALQSVLPEEIEVRGTISDSEIRDAIRKLLDGTVSHADPQTRRMPTPKKFADTLRTAFQEKLGIHATTGVDLDGHIRLFINASPDHAKTFENTIQAVAPDLRVQVTGIVQAPFISRAQLSEKLLTLIPIIRVRPEPEAKSIVIVKGPDRSRLGAIAEILDESES